jgi:prepilin-type N-terminal cleavage/methylation domain-containing protein
MRRPRRRAFTLVEMLVVVAIIALLLAILLPAMDQARYATRLATCATGVRQIALASTSYATDFTAFYPGSRDKTQPLRGRSFQDYPEGLAPYCGGSVDKRDNDLWVCPEATRMADRFDKNPSSYYNLYYNCVGGLYSGMNGDLGNFFRGYVPNEPDEAMRRIGQHRIFKEVKHTGNQAWKAQVLVSDISHRMGFNGAVQSGHMWKGTYSFGGYSALGFFTKDALCTANYGFQDGSVTPYRYTATGLGSTMAAANDGPLNWDSYLLPKDTMQLYP